MNIKFPPHKSQTNIQPTKQPYIDLHSQMIKCVGVHQI